MRVVGQDPFDRVSNHGAPVNLAAEDIEVAARGEMAAQHLRLTVEKVIGERLWFVIEHAGTDECRGLRILRLVVQMHRVLPKTAGGGDPKCRARGLGDVDESERANGPEAVFAIRRHRSPRR